MPNRTHVIDKASQASQYFFLNYSADFIHVFLLVGFDIMHCIYVFIFKLSSGPISGSRADNKGNMRKAMY